MLELLWLPFLACLVLTGIHVYLGLHVLARGVIFVDLALAQIAALGISVAVLAGHPIQSDPAYWYALAFTMGGAAVFALSRLHAAPVPAGAIIGIVYAVSAAVSVLVVDRAPQGCEHIKQLLVGRILIVTTFGVMLAAVAIVLGVVVLRRRVLEHGVRALAGVLITTGAVIALAGGSLLAFPAMDQPWLAAVEHAVPGAALAFLDHEEREEYAESREGVAEGEAELERVTQMRDDVQWGRRVMSPDMQERLRQYIAGRQEMVTGDRLVLRALRQKARERQRYGLGLPLTFCGLGAIGAGLWLGRPRS